MSVRLRRLQAEYERITQLFEKHERIRIVETYGNPPERYVVEYRLRGLVEEKGEIKERIVHRAQIVLGRNYPNELPRCNMLTPVFHPNIDHLRICTEDIGAAGKTIDQVITFIGEMIAFQTYNVKSPLNGDAARWTIEHMNELPLERVDLLPKATVRAPSRLPAVEPLPPQPSPYQSPSQPLPPPSSSPYQTAQPASPYQTAQPYQSSQPYQTSQPAPPTVFMAGANTGQTTPLQTPQTTTPLAPLEKCVNCGQSVPASQLESCVGNHRVCADCALSCQNCQQTICVLCYLRTCANCKSLVCTDCQITCDTSAHPICTDCSFPCEHCRKSVCVLCNLQNCTDCKALVCPDCLVNCNACGRPFCSSDIMQCKVCQNLKCSDCLVKCARCGGLSCVAHINAAGLCSGCATMVANPSDAESDPQTASKLFDSPVEILDLDE